MSTVPYLYTDLLSPNSLQNSVESLFADSLSEAQPPQPQQGKNSTRGKEKKATASVIPVRTWSRGSPFRGSQQRDTDGDEHGRESESYDDGGLAAYLANMELLEAEPGSAALQASDALHSGLDMDEDELRSFMMPVDEEMDGPQHREHEQEREEEEDVHDDFERDFEQEFKQEYNHQEHDQEDYEEDYFVDDGEEEEEEEEDDHNNESDDNEEDEEDGDDRDNDNDNDDHDGEQDDEDEEDYEDDHEDDDDDNDNDSREGEGEGEGEGEDAEAPLSSQFADMMENPEQFLSLSSYVSQLARSHTHSQGEGRYAEEEQRGEEGEEDNEMRAIVNDYTELLSYMDSPRRDAHKPSQTHTQGQTQAQLQKAFLRENLSVLLRKESESISQKREKQAPNSNGNHANSNYKRNNKKTEKPQGGGSKKSSGALHTQSNAQAQAMHQPEFVFPTSQALSQMYCEPPALPAKKKKAKEDKQKKNKKNKDKNNKGKGKKDPEAAREVAMRHKAMLQEIANKRKQEEEEMLLLAQQQEQRRKKFREALLEKAMRARQQQVEEEELQKQHPTEVVELPPKKTNKQPAPNNNNNRKAFVTDTETHAPAAVHTKPLPANSSLLQPTTAYKLQTVQKPAQEALSEEEAKRMEEEKREYIAAIRRKFKEQHKLILSQLATKKKEEQEKSEQEQALEEKRRERRKKKLMQMLAVSGRDSARERDTENALTEREEGEENNGMLRTRSAAEKKTTSPSAAVAGSALAVVRQRTSVSQPVYEKTRREREREKELQRQRESEAEERKDDGIADEAAQQKKQQRNKANNAKLTDYLLSLTEQKKKEEAEKKKQEERQKKRVQLLSQRLLQEAHERKLMAQEDSRNAVTNSNNTEEEKKQKAAKKITPEMAEVIAQRLRTKQSAVAAAATENNPSEKTSTGSNAASKIPRPPRVSVDRNRENNNNNDDASSTTTTNNNNTTSTATNTVTVTSTVPARDYADWKRKNGVPADGRVFCMTGWYPCVKQALLERGWFFNPDPLSPFFHLKWTLRSIDVNQETLQSWQLTNHYLKNVAITTKAGLIKSLQNVVWLADVDCRDIIPRAYDLSIQDDMRAFLDDFRCQKAESVLKKLYFSLTGKECAVPPRRSRVVGKNDKKKKGKKDKNNTDKERETARGSESRRSSFTAVGSAANVVKSRAQSREQSSRPSSSLSHALSVPGNDAHKHETSEHSIVREEKGADNEKEDCKTYLADTQMNDDDDSDQEEEEEYCNSDSSSLSVPPCPPPKPDVNLESMCINGVVFESLCRLLESVLRPVDDDFLDDMQESNNSSNAQQSVLSSKLVADLDWEIVSNYSLFQSVSSLPFDPPEPVDGFLSSGNNNSNNGNGNNNSSSGRDDELQEMALSVAMLSSTGGNALSSFQQQQLQQQLARERKRQQRLYEEARESASERIKQMRALTQRDLERVHRLLSRLHVSHGSQAHLNGPANHAENIWIVKPAAKSRGRGITTFNDLPKLLKYVEAGSGLSTQWIVQKYMENPLIIAKRKFDLRQWVLVTDWNPLTIYFYRECYARFSVEEYTTENDALDNAYVHLVNNSIGKNSENFNKTVTAENGVAIDGYMWSYEDLRSYIHTQTGSDLLIDKITPRMKEITQYSLMCASEMIEHRKNSWELYGFDFMIDDDYNAWLIEINSSPACDYSTKVTERYIQKALVELLNVVLDVREWEAQPKRTRGEKPDTGDWEMIYQGLLLEKPIGSFGTEMSLKGEGLKTNRPRPAPAPAAPILGDLATSSVTSSSSNNARQSSKTNSFSSTNANGSSAKRPTAGGISYAPSAAAASSSKRAVPATSSSSSSTNNGTAHMKSDPLSGGDFDDSDEERKPARRSEHLVSKTAASEKPAITHASSKTAKSIPSQSTAPPNATAIPVKVFSVEF